MYTPYTVIAYSILTTCVSMLSQDPSVEAARVDSQFVSHQETEACRVQVGAAADDTVLWKPAQFPGHISQYIDCQREGEIYSVKR